MMSLDDERARVWAARMKAPAAVPEKRLNNRRSMANLSKKVKFTQAAPAGGTPRLKSNRLWIRQTV